MKTILLNNKQLEVVMDALEIFDRLNGGQIEIAMEVLRKNADGKFKPLADHTVEHGLKTAYQAQFKHGSPQNEGRHSWHANHTAYRAREIAQAIRRHLALERNGGEVRSCDNSFDRPLLRSGELEVDIKGML